MEGQKWKRTKAVGAAWAQVQGEVALAHAHAITHRAGPESPDDRVRNAAALCRLNKAEVVLDAALKTAALARDQVVRKRRRPATSAVARR
jgi:hypothetical protein